MKFKELLALLKADLLRLEAPADNTLVPRPKWVKLLSPRFLPVLLVRLARYFYLSRWVRMFSPVFTWVNLIIFGIEFTPRCEVGAGLMLPHTSGTVVGALKIGVNATIFHGVTLGAKFADIHFTPETRPVVGDNVTFGAGAKALGGIFIGQGAVIAANSLVIEDVAAGALMMGVPAIARGVPQ